MARYVAFLRGMNLGRRRIKNPEHCAAFEDIGFKNVAAYLASGNVIFDADDAVTDSVAESIEFGLKESLGYDVPTFLRTADEVRVIATSRPFASVTSERAGKMQVAMLSDVIGEAARKAVLELSNDGDLLELSGRELYW